MKDNKKYEEEKEERESDRRKRIIIYIIIIIIIILSLLTSCSCTSKFFGKIGDMFGNEGDYIIDEDTDDLEIIRNKYLKFDKDSLEVSLGDDKAKLSFSYKNIKPDEFTCKTSDAKVATCYVSGNHVVIIPKKKGKVKVILQTKANNKIYEATAKIFIKDSNRYIKLSSTSGTINLAKDKEKIICYTLVGLSGKVSAISSDNSIAKVIVEDGYFKIIGYKKGKVTITVSTIYNGKTYTTLYTLDVIDTGKANNSNKDNNKNNESSGGNSNNNGETGSTGGTNYKDSDNLLKSIKVSSDSTIFDLSPKFNSNEFKYTVRVGSDIDYVNIEALARSDKATIKYNGDKVSTLEDLELEYGKNTVVITVTAEDGSKKDYIVYIIKERDASDYYLSVVGNKDIEMRVSSVDKKNGPLTGIREFILNTNLFSEDVEITNLSNKKVKICSKVENNCVTVSSDSSLIDRLKYIGNKEENIPNYLPFEITASESGKAKIHISGSFGKEKIEFDVNVDVVREYYVVLNAQDGEFLDTSKEQSPKISKDEILYLKDYDEPRKLVNNDECSYYRFIGYSKTPNGKVEFTTTDDNNNKISNIDSDMTLYAIYDETKTYPLEDEKTIWLIADGTDLGEVPLFHNKKYFEKYGEDKVIYPGANGYYIMKFKNNTSNTITLKELNLQEETICVTGGCLNMGYIVMYRPQNSSNALYYYGGENDYKILNEDVNPNDINYKGKTITLGSGIKVESGKEIAISLFWKWDDKNDSVDTLIGDQAADSRFDSNINDDYSLYVSLKYTSDNKCHTSSSSD